MREMILLGAGASVEAGIPGAFEMTRKIADIFRNSPHHRTGSRVLSFVIGGLLFKRGIEGDDALASGVNVEELFNAVQLLAERGRLEASPFVGSWHAVVDDLDQIAPPEASLSAIHRAIQKGVAEQVKAAIPSYVAGFAASDIDRNLQGAITAMAQGRAVGFRSFSSLSHAVGNYISDYIKQWTEKLRSTTPHNSELEHELRKLANQKPKPGQGRVFEFVAEQMIRTLIDIVWIRAPEKVNYLTPLMMHAAAQPTMVIATLNYDNTVELAASATGVACDTGIAEWSQTGKFAFRPQGVSLLKLHGSIEWEQDLLGGPDMMEHLHVRSVDLTDRRKNGYRPAVIFGHRNKLTAEGPFLDLLHVFIDKLDSSDMLTVIGYSFGDPHINALLTRWMNGKTTRKLRIVNPSFRNIHSKFTAELARLGNSRVTVIQEDTGAALLTLYGESRQEVPISSSTGKGKDDNDAHIPALSGQEGN